MPAIQLLLIALCLFICTCVNPPFLPDSFQVAFDETQIQNKTQYKVNGQWYYDAKNSRERVDRINGRYNMFCGSVLPNVTTPCTQLTVDNKRWIIYPQKKQCCFCCDSKHGCGVLNKFWTEDAKFLGTQRLIDTYYNKWSKDGSFSYNYYWTTISDQPIPRRLDEGGNHITDYLTQTFINKMFDDSYFALPEYCKDSCPSTTICGKLRMQSEGKVRVE